MSGESAPSFDARCWNQIGSAGDRSCERLQQARHCRHCEVYVDAATQIMRQPLDPKRRVAWAEELRQPEPIAQVDDRAALAFRIGSEWLMMAAARIDGVSPQAPVHCLPHRSGGALLGVVNVDGRLTPAIDLAHLLGIERAAPAIGGRHVFARLVVMIWQDQTFAVPADEVDGMLRYRQDELRPPPSSGSAQLVRALLLRNERRIGLLDDTALGDRMWRSLR